MNKRTNFIITLLGGFLGIHKFVQKKTKLGFLYLFTLGLFGIGWIVDVVIAFIALKNESTEDSSIRNESYDSPYHHLEDLTMYNSHVVAYANKYYQGIDDIEAMWSVMYNLQIISGEQVENFIAKCYENLSDLQNLQIQKSQYGYDTQMPSKIPAYVRLAMLYEKQGNYEKAIDICVESIKAGATHDGNKGTMYGRLARLIRKSGIEVNQDILRLMNQND